MVVYWTVNNILSIGQQYILLKKQKKKSYLIEGYMNSEWFFLKEAHSLSGLPNDNIPEYIFWGRSNVGKSSLINLLTKKNLAKLQKLQEEQKVLFFFNLKKQFRIVDFPGYGFSYIPEKKVIKLDNLIEGYLKKEKILKNFSFI